MKMLSFKKFIKRDKRIYKKSFFSDPFADAINKFIIEDIKSYKPFTISSK